MSEDGANPMKSAQRLARQTLPKRFYKRAEAGPHEGGFAVLLDGRVARTPARNPLAVPGREVAEALAAEWEAQKADIKPATMPLTRLVNAAIDRVAPEMAVVRDDLIKHAGADLILYRAEGPQSLIDEENRLWSPVQAWAEATLGVRFILAEGIHHVAQSPEALGAVGAAIDDDDPLRLAALHSATTLTGSALIALAVARGALSPEAAWEAAHADEDWQMRHWGRDEDALAERAGRWAQMQAAARILAESGATEPLSADGRAGKS